LFARHNFSNPEGTLWTRSSQSPLYELEIQQKKLPLPTNVLHWHCKTKAEWAYRLHPGMYQLEDYFSNGF
jgi:hypothetical protein